MSETIDQRLQAIEQGIEDALSVLVQALCRQVRPRQLADDLAQLLDESGELYPSTPLGVRLVLRAQEAAEASMTAGELYARYPRSSEPD